MRNDPLCNPRVQRPISDDEQRRIVASMTKALLKGMPKMPHDKNGALIQVGDRVVLRGKVKNIGTSELYCNLTIELDEPMPTDTGPRAGETISGINAKQVELEAK